MNRAKKIFLSGFFTLIPILATIYVFYFLFSFFDTLVGNSVETLLGRKLPGIGVIVSIVVIFGTGVLVTNVIGAKFLVLSEKLLHRIPFVTKIYFGVKQIIQAFTLQDKGLFEKVVLVEYPRKGSYVVGFVTGECTGEVQKKTSERLINVFIPTTPNPTSGMLVLLPSKDIIYLDMTVEDGLKLIISAGVVVPPNQD